MGDKKNPDRDEGSAETSCCTMEAVVSVDERGQMVLPKSVRDKARIAAGDRLGVVTWEKDGEVCCISLVKMAALSNMVKDVVGPVMKEILA